MNHHLQKRNRSYFRYQRQRVISRKLKLVNFLGYSAKYPGYFAKGKVHCSCWMCSVKTRKNGFPISQKSQIESLKYKLELYYKENNK